MAIPSIALIPTGTKAGTLYSVLPEDGSGDFTVVRATTATRVNENGLIESVANNVPRLDYTDGGCPVLLTEPQSTNLVTYSEDFSNAAWIKTGVTAIAPVVTSNFIISPDGTQNADKIVFPIVSSGRSILYFPITTVVSSYSNSIYLKGELGGEKVWLMNTKNGVDYFKVECVLTTDWKSFSYSASLTAGGDNVQFGIDNRDASQTSTTIQTVYVWGAQLEALSYPTSYIPTTGSSVTRNADQVTDSGDVNDFNSTEGVFMAEISALADDLTFRVISLSDGTSSNSIWLYYSADSNVIKIYDGTNALAYSTDTTVNSKVAYVYDAVSTRLYINGFNVGSIAFKSFSGFNNLTFKDDAGTNPFYGKTKQLQVFKSALTSLEIETLTSWESFILMASAQQYTIY